jgi:type IV secretion system protein VirD4
MSRRIQNHVDNQSWGPTHQQMTPPWQRREPSGWWRFGAWFAGAMFLHELIDNGGSGEITWCLKAMAIGWVAKHVIQGVRDGRIPIAWLRVCREEMAWWLGKQFVRHAPRRIVGLVARWRLGAPDSEQEVERTPAQQARWEVECKGGGAYLGVGEGGEWISAEAESAVMVLGPPRSGKTSAVMIPAVLGACGPVVSTSTKPDVMDATSNARAQIGEVWLFDPSGSEPQIPAGVRRLCWSPVAAAGTWDDALIMARAMTACTRVGAGTTAETHWTERATALLAPLLYAAHLTDRPIEEVLRWTLHQDPTTALEVLADQGHEIAAAVLVGIERTDGRERSSIFSATAGVLAAYNADATRATAKDPNFDPKAFAESADTIYITAPEQHQALCAPLIVGLLEQIRHATYNYCARRQREGLYASQRMLWALDEIANIAPIHDLPALVSQAGGQNLQVLVGLQDLSQARTRWGDAAADGFMSLFQTRLVLDGIADSRTLESISLAIGEYDRDLVSSSTGRSEKSDEWFGPHNSNDSVSYQTHRQRVLSPGEIAQLPNGHALLLRGAAWDLLQLTPWHACEPWATIANTPS